MEFVEDHILIFLECWPKAPIFYFLHGQKRISVEEIFKRHPQVRKELWGGEFVQDGSIAMTVDDNVTKLEIIQFIKHYWKHEKFPHRQFSVF